MIDPMPWLCGRAIIVKDKKYNNETKTKSDTISKNTLTISFPLTLSEKFELRVHTILID